MYFVFCSKVSVINTVDTSHEDMIVSKISPAVFQIINRRLSEAVVMYNEFA